jgi:hypothetical protein
LPLRQGFGRGGHRSRDIRRSSLGNRRQFLTICRINTLDHHGVGSRLLPATADKQPKATLVRIEPLIGDGSTFGSGAQ